MATRGCLVGIATSLALLGCARRTVVVTEPAPPPRARVEERGPVATLGIPPGQMPRPGECRVWIRGLSPGRQPRPKSRSCAGIERTAPAGSWILYRPARGARVVRVRMVDERRAGIVVRVRVFEIDSGKFLREEQP
jgi:hypothetical protein